MINKDLIKQQNTLIMQKMTDALKSNDAEGAANALQEIQTGIMDAIENEFNQYKDVSDMNVLQSRGLRTLTSEETEWYQKFIKAAKSGAKQDITNLTSAMPVTIIDRVIEDMKKEHALLSEINIQNAAGAQKLVMNGVQMASKLFRWGAIGSAIAEQLTGAIKVADVTTAKGTAYFIIPKDFVKFNFTFAPMWVDQYIRLILSEAVAFGLEKAIVEGNGNNCMIGMEMDISTNSGGTYSKKTKTVLADFEDAYTAVIADLAIDGNGDTRVVPEVLMIVNPVTYIKKIRRVQNAIVPGIGVVDLLSNSYPTKVVQSVMVAEDDAVVGIAKNYFCGINGGNSGIIEYSDEFQFLDDNRVYTTRVYGHGQPIDNTSFAYLDISGAEAPAFPVKVKGTVKTKEQA